MPVIRQEALVLTASSATSRRLRCLPLATDMPLLTRVKGFDDLPTREQIDFIAACFKFGVSACDFEFSMIEHYSHLSPSPQRRVAHIGLRNGTQAQTYVADADVDWITLFIFDFSMGIFDTAQY